MQDALVDLRNFTQQQGKIVVFMTKDQLALVYQYASGLKIERLRDFNRGSHKIVAVEIQLQETSPQLRE